MYEVEHVLSANGVDIYQGWLAPSETRDPKRESLPGSTERRLATSA